MHADTYIRSYVLTQHLTVNISTLCIHLQSLHPPPPPLSPLCSMPVITIGVIALLVLVDRTAHKLLLTHAKGLTVPETAPVLLLLLGTGPVYAILAMLVITAMSSTLALGSTVLAMARVSLWGTPTSVSVMTVILERSVIR